MNNGLNIPLTSTRQTHWRVLELIAIGLCAVALGWLAKQSIRAALTYRSISSQGDTSIIIQKNADTELLIRTNLRGVSAIPGGPWSLIDALQFSNQNIIISQAGERTELTLDNERPDLVNMAKQFDLDGKIRDGVTIISTNTIIDGEFVQIPWYSLGIFRNNLVATVRFDEHAISSVSYHRKHNRLIAHNIVAIQSPVGAISGSTKNIIVAAGFPVSALTSITTSSLPIAFPGFLSFLELATSSGMSLLLSTDANNSTFFTVNVGASNISLETLTNIGRDLLAASMLRLEEFALPNNETAIELVTTTPAISERTEGDFTFIDLSNRNATIRIIKGPASITFTNDILSEATVTTPFSTPCASSARGLINLKAISMLQTQHAYHPSTPMTVLWKADMLAQTSDDLRLCW